MMPTSSPAIELLMERGIGIAAAAYLGWQVVKWFNESRAQIKEQSAAAQTMIAQLQTRLDTTNAEKEAMTIEYMNSLRDFRSTVEKLSTALDKNSSAIDELREEMRELREKTK